MYWSLLEIARVAFETKRPSVLIRSGLLLGAVGINFPEYSFALTRGRESEGSRRKADKSEGNPKENGKNSNKNSNCSVSGVLPSRSLVETSTPLS